MRHNSQRPSGKGFEDWNVRANEARRRLTEQWMIANETVPERTTTWRPQFNEKLYKEFRDMTSSCSRVSLTNARIASATIAMVTLFK